MRMNNQQGELLRQLALAMSYDERKRPSEPSKPAERKTNCLKRKDLRSACVSKSQVFVCYSVPKGYAVISRQPTAYTIIHILRDIPHKVIEYLDFACFVYLVFLIDINFVDEIS